MTEAQEQVLTKQRGESADIYFRKMRKEYVNKGRISVKPNGKILLRVDVDGSFATYIDRRLPKKNKIEILQIIANTLQAVTIANIKKEGA